MSAAWAAAASGSRPARRRTASALTTITDSVCPSRSCRSRLNRSRSSTTATRASSLRVRRSSSTVSISRRNEVVAIPASSTPPAVVQNTTPRSPSSHEATISHAVITGIATTEGQPRSTAGVVITSRIHGESQPSPWVEPSTAAAASTARATYGVRPCRTGSPVITATRQAPTMVATSSSWKATWAGLPCRLSSGASTRTGSHTTMEA